MTNYFFSLRVTQAGVNRTHPTQQFRSVGAGFALARLWEGIKSSHTVTLTTQTNIGISLKS